jgi:TonB family protein
MIASIDTSGVEVSMPHPRTAKDNVLVVFLASVAFLISGIVTASPSPSAQEGYFKSPPHEGRMIPAPRGQEFPISLEVLSSVPDKVNLNPYLDRLYFSIRRNLLAKLPESAASEETGVVVVRVHLQKDGSLPENSVRIVFKSGKIDMDAAVLTAIRTATPFGHLPEEYLASNLDLLFTFYFRSIPPAQRPNFVPVRIATNHLFESITMERP